MVLLHATLGAGAWEMWSGYVDVSYYMHLSIYHQKHHFLKDSSLRHG
jgi:hypothetical protein